MWDEIVKIYCKYKHTCKKCRDYRCEGCVFFMEGTYCDYCQLFDADIKAEAPPCKYFLCYYFLKGAVKEDTRKWCKIWEQLCEK